MTSPRSSQKSSTGASALTIAACSVLLLMLGAILWYSWTSSDENVFTHVSTVAGKSSEFGETFGVAITGREIYVSDGQHGKIWRINGDEVKVFAEGLHTPSAIAFGRDGNLIVADSGTHTIKSVNSNGEITTIAGVEGKAGLADGEAKRALFNAPIGIAVAEDKIYVADTYNDRIRVIEDGKVSTLADKGFDTPCGIAVWRDKLLVADTGTRKIRVVEPDGSVWTLAGNGESRYVGVGLPLSTSFVQPTALAVDKNGAIFVADGDAIRQIHVGLISTVRTITDEHRGLKDGHNLRARFNRPTGLAFDNNGNLLVADSENRLVRRLSTRKYGHEITSDEIAALRGTAKEFRDAAPPRWPFDPPEAKRDIAGTLGEIRGEMIAGNDQVWFHNGLDIAGAYGETARFIRDEKVLRPMAVDNFGNLRESLRMPTLGYVHVRVGRDVNDTPFRDERFLFNKSNGKLTQVRVRRGTQFKAGDAIGTLNAMNHVHLVVGRSGGEMNALDALILPNLTDARAPTIEKVTLVDESMNEIETTKAESHKKLADKFRIVVRAFDQIDGNPDRRRLGVYKLGYQLLREDGTQVTDVNWTIKFDRLPPNVAIPFTYANGSRSGATVETKFDYIATNIVNGDQYRAGFIDTTTYPNGRYTLRVIVADYFGNQSQRDLNIEVSR